jgi:hypothetical protein
LAKIEKPALTYLNIGFGKLITDEGLNAFEGKTFPIETLIMSGCTGISGAGLLHPITACKETL